MQAKAIVYKPNETYKFILFQVVPLALGILITCQSIANANWDDPDPLLIENPVNQGWNPVK